MLRLILRLALTKPRRQWLEFDYRKYLQDIHTRCGCRALMRALSWSYALALSADSRYHEHDSADMFLHGGMATTRSFLIKFKWRVVLDDDISSISIPNIHPKNRILVAPRKNFCDSRKVHKPSRGNPTVLGADEGFTKESELESLEILHSPIRFSD